jgi:hypothetical protein
MSLESLVTTQSRPYNVDDLNNLIKSQDRNFEKGKISDGYHTFDELYEFRKVYNAALFNEWAMLWNENKQAIIAKYDVHKSWKHSDGELCFGGGWFIVVAVLPDGQISNHYEAKDWDLFKIPETEKAKFEFDGHTSTDVLERLRNL